MTRYTVLDIIRGIALINMILYHAIWDIINIFGVNVPLFNSQFGLFWQQSICITFILLSGFCSAFAKRNFKNGITVLICSVIITIVTALFMPDTIILFGILSLLGSCMIIAALLGNILKKLNPYIVFFSLLILFLITKNLPEIFGNSLFTAYLGFPPNNFISNDYFPLIPWIFLYFNGYYLYYILIRTNSLKFLSAVRCKPLEFLGRHSLIIYMLHQPVIYFILYLKSLG